MGGIEDKKCPPVIIKMEGEIEEKKYFYKIQYRIWVQKCGEGNLLHTHSSPLLKMLLQIMFKV